MAFTVADVQALAPGLPQPLAQIVLEEWVETGDFDLAVAAMRQSDQYEIYFPGNRREDGSLRYNEATYLANMEAYAQELASVDLNPDLDGFVSLIEGSVSPREFASRVQAVTARVLTRADEIREYYAQVANIEMTDAAIIGSIIDPNLNEAILARDISVAEIGAEASMRDLNLDLETAERLFEFGRDGPGDRPGGRHPGAPALRSRRRLRPERVPGCHRLRGREAEAPSPAVVPGRDLELLAADGRPDRAGTVRRADRPQPELVDTPPPSVVTSCARGGPLPLG